MNLLPTNLYEKLEFDKVLHLLEAECMGSLGQAHFENLTLTTDINALLPQLRAAKELKIVLEKGESFPFSNYYAINEDLRMLAIDGYVLSVESLQRINAILLIVKEVYRFFQTPLRRELSPTLWAELQPYSFDEALSKEITRVIDEQGQIRADASPELVKIRKMINGKVQELDRVYRAIISDFRQKGWLAETTETFRNGRRVLTVPSEHKRKIRGIIHDESATGKTAYIEPEAAIEVNNDLFDLETEEKAEIYRILRQLSATLRPYCPHLADYQTITERFDIILAKAKLAIKMKANMPNVTDKPQFGIKKGRHPLLYLRNRAAQKETVAMTLELHEGNRILVLSGPNAGGKSIAMKTVGLLQLMLQAGILIPVSEFSEMGIFERIFVQIGDAQSIEDDLSTYSSHLQNMNQVVRQANEKTLFLIDEFGSGTDPKMGGSIAEAMLRSLNFRHAWGVVTTHYGNLKMFAYKTKGIVNGCMNFDKDNLSPTYQMTVGRPGSSYAFEIATKVGLDEKTLEYAKRRIGENEQAVDELLIDLQREKQELEEKLADVNEKQKTLEKLIKNYDEQVKDVEFRRKKLKLDSKELLLQQTAKENKEMEGLMRELRQAKNLDKAKEITQKIKEQQTQLSEEVTQLTEDIYYQPNPKISEKAIEVGDFVKMRTGVGATGKIESIDKNTATVLMGEMRMKMKLRDLVHVEQPTELRQERKINTNGVEKIAMFNPQIDIRGMDMSTAHQSLELFLDQALLTSNLHLRIVHGKGSGVLRKVVQQKLKEYKGIKRNFHPEPNDGGDGVTVVEF